MTSYIFLNKLKNTLPNEDTQDLKMYHYHAILIEEEIEIIFILIVSKISLKIKLYIYHYIGLIICIAFSIGIDALLQLPIIKPGIKFLSLYIVFLYFRHYFYHF